MAIEHSSASAVTVKPLYGAVYPNDKTHSESPYHVFALRKKKQLAYIASFAGLFSPLSSNIYFPALDAIANVRLPTARRIYQLTAFLGVSCSDLFSGLDHHGVHDCTGYCPIILGPPFGYSRSSTYIYGNICCLSFIKYRTCTDEQFYCTHGAKRSPSRR